MDEETVSALVPLQYDTLTRSEQLYGITGDQIGSIAEVPPIICSQILRDIRAMRAGVTSLKSAEFRKVANIFMNDSLCGLPFDKYVKLVSSISGLPLSLIEESGKKIAENLLEAESMAMCGLPSGCHPLPKSNTNSVHGIAVSKRRGDLFSVIAAGNGPGIHAIWPQALALGYSVIVKPSKREPFTAQRLVSAFRCAGFSSQVFLLPGGHESTDTIVQESDISLVYGTSDVTYKYKDTQTVLPQGPGNSKLIISRDYSEAESLSVAFESICGLGGVACVNCSAILADGMDIDIFARNLNKFCVQKFCDKTVRQDIFPRVSEEKMKMICDYAKSLSNELVSFPEVINNNDGSYYVSPVIYTGTSLKEACEMPFAAVGIFPLNRNDLNSCLENSLVVSVASSDKQLIEAICEISGISNIYIGSVPTTTMETSMPHDGYISTFLTKAVGYKRKVNVK